MKKIAAVDIVKTAFNGIVSLSVGSIVGNLSEYFLPKNLKLLSKAGLSLATFILTNMVSNGVSNVIETEIDNTVNT